jgi:hypothetical protein
MSYEHVYVLRYKNGGVLGVFSTRAKAQREKEEYKANKAFYQCLIIEEHLVG